MQVAAPPKGSISVGWLWVSFFDCAGVDLLALVQVGEHALGLQILRADGGDVHQAHGLRAVQLAPDGQVALIGGLHVLILEGHVPQLREEGGVAAVVGPVGVDHADLGERGVAMLIPEIGLAEGDIRGVHGQAVAPDEVGKLRRGIIDEAPHGLHRGGDGVGGLQRIHRLQGRLAALHRVDHVLLDARDIRFGQLARQDVHRGGAHVRALALGQQLDALGRGIGPLVELAGQVLRREDHAGILRQLAVDVVHHRLGEHIGHGLLEQRRVDVLHVVAVQDPHARHPPDAQEGLQLVIQRGGLVIEAGLLFSVYAIDHVSSSPSSKSPAPACRYPGAGSCRPT